MFKTDELAGGLSTTFSVIRLRLPFDGVLAMGSLRSARNIHSKASFAFDVVPFQFARSWRRKGRPPGRSPRHLDETTRHQRNRAPAVKPQTDGIILQRAIEGSRIA